MAIAIFGTSSKPFEKRIPLHPDHIVNLPNEILSQMAFEENYGSEFGFDIKLLEERVFGIFSRDELFDKFTTLVLPKITDLDCRKFKNNQVIYGWPHCVQGVNITQVAIEKKLTLVAFESMFSGSGEYRHHIFHKNNEIAGFAAVQHCTQLRGITGYYGGLMKAFVFGFGSTGRGAIHALKSQGISDITVFTKRPSHLVEQQIPGVKFQQYTVKNGVAFDIFGKTISSLLSNVDIIVNCILQDPNDPITFIGQTKDVCLKDNSIIIDVSCDEGMGFYFSRPTTFDEPGFLIDGTNSYYYSVDHTPSYFWNSSSFELSLSLLPFLKYLLVDYGYKKSDILDSAVEIDSGFIMNDDILVFQDRETNYPYRIKTLC